ncbi:MAG: hypothetical protein NTV07_06555 [Candidatus Omnitrophica bacterium]|nr:hypothetical protein [Candidatus Omnitrophota bacterium]
MGKYISVLGGLIAILLGAAGLLRWLGHFINALKASVPAILILGGLIAVAAGVSEIKDAARAKKEEGKEEKK